MALRLSGLCRALARRLRAPVSGLQDATFVRGNTFQRCSFATKKEETEDDIDEDVVDGGDSSIEDNISTKREGTEDEIDEDVVDAGDSSIDDNMEEETGHPEDSIKQDTKYPKKEVATTPFGSFGPGIYKAITLGHVGQAPSQKMFKDGSTVVIFSLGTGGLRNNRKQYDGEASDTYAERSFTQWHKVCIFKQGLQELAMKIKKGTNVYVEGNIETRVFSDPVTGALKRLREICVRQNGRLYIVDKDGAKYFQQNA